MPEKTGAGFASPRRLVEASASSSHAWPRTRPYPSLDTMNTIKNSLNTRSSGIGAAKKCRPITETQTIVIKVTNETTEITTEMRSIQANIFTVRSRGSAQAWNETPPF